MSNGIAQTIAGQLGNRALAMLGAQDLMAEENALMFRIRGSKTARKIRIVLEESDTYTVEFWKGADLKIAKVAEFPGVYVADLHQTIERFTGLYTSL